MEKNAKIFYEPAKAKYVYRLAAFLIDIIIFVILLTGVLFVLSKITNFDTHYNNLHQQYQTIGYEIYDEENDKYNIISSDDPNYDYVMELYQTDKVIEQEEGYINSYVLNAPLIAIAFCMLILEFIVPLILKKGRTIGMLIFHIGLISTSLIKVKSQQLFAGAFIGKVVIFGMVPYICLFNSFFRVGGGLGTTIFLILLLATNLVLILFTNNHNSIADKIASLYPVDDNQTIYFNDLEELNQAKKDLKHEQESQKKVY